MDKNKKRGAFFTIRDTTDKVYLGVIILLVLVSATLTFIVFDQKENNEVIALERQDLEVEKDNLTEELTDMLDQYNDLEMENEELTEEMIQQKEEIQKLLEEVEKGKVNAQQVVKYRKEVRTLRTVLKGYVYTMDSLNTVNIELTNENLEIKGQLGSATKRYKKLQEAKSTLEEKVAVASQLKSLFMSAEAIRVRFNGKQSETKRADRAESIKVCLRIAANNTAEAGVKTMYTRVITPEGRILANVENPNDRIPVKGLASATYSGKRAFRYENDETDFCMYIQLKEPLIPGDYIIEAYEGGGMVGQTELILR